MDAVKLAVQFLTQGYVVVPNVVVGDELEAMQDAFERLSSRLGKRGFTPAEIETAPELVQFIGHPRAMPVIEAFMGFYGHKPAIAWLHLCRDIFDPAAPPPLDNSVERAALNLHNDASNARELGMSFRTLNAGLAAFLWLDDTYPDAGSLLQVPGSHHLSYPSDDGCVVSPTPEFVRQHCPIECVAARAGDMVLQRCFNFHGTGPLPRHKRRQLRADYTPIALYHNITLDGRTDVHQKFSPTTRDLLPADRQRYFHA